MAKGKSKGGGDDKVGYKRPPKVHQFKPGESGNPRGPRKEWSTFTVAIRAQGDQVIEPVIDGKKQELTLREAVARLLYAKAMKGNTQAIAIIDKIESRAPPPETREGGQGRIRFTLRLEEPDGPDEIA
jgi:hypothetical protein